MPRHLIARRLGLREYAPVVAAMRAFTDARGASDTDEFWLLEHPPLFTLGLNGKPEHLLAPGTIPVVHTDRGGQVTYHGPGQLIVYSLIDLKRAGLSVRELVMRLEHAVIDCLAAHGVAGYGRRDAPGVYVDGRKLASLGLRVRRGCSYHGLSLNVAMDLQPFTRINPCGYAGLKMTDLRALGLALDVQSAGDALIGHLCHTLGYSGYTMASALPADHHQERQHVSAQ